MTDQTPVAPLAAAIAAIAAELGTVEKRTILAAGAHGYDTGENRDPDPSSRGSMRHSIPFRYCGMRRCGRYSNRTALRVGKTRRPATS